MRINHGADLADEVLIKLCCRRFGGYSGRIDKPNVICQTPCAVNMKIIGQYRDPIGAVRIALVQQLLGEQKIFIGTAGIFFF